MDSMDRDESVDALNASIAESMAEVSRLNNELVGLESYRTKILAEGMSKSIGIGLEHIAPGTLGNLNLNMLTEVPTSTKMNVALESIDWKSKITKVAIVILVVTVILKMLDWLLTPSRGALGGGKNDGNEAAKAIHEAKEKIREEIKKVGKDIHERPTQNVVAAAAAKDEDWMRPVYKVLEELLDKKRMSDKEALRAIEIMNAYRNSPITGFGDREVNLATLFIFMLKSGLPLSLASFGFYLGLEPGRAVSKKLPIPFSISIFEYSRLRNNLDYALLTISRILKQGVDAGVDVERNYKAAGNKALFGDYVGEIAREVTMYNEDLKKSFDYVFGNAQDPVPFIFVSDKDVAKWVPNTFTINRYGKLAEDKKTYIGQTKSGYDHALFLAGVIGRNSTSYTVVGKENEDFWWGDGYRVMVEHGMLDLRERQGDKDIKYPSEPLTESIADWMVSILCTESELKLMIDESNRRMNALREEFMNAGNKETERLKDLCEKMLAELKVIEARARQSVPTVWHVPWKNTTGLHYSDVDLTTGRDRGVIESTFGEVCTHLLNGTKAQLNAFITTKTVYQKIEKSYLAFREAVEKFRA